MGRIAIVNDSPETVAMLKAFLTKGSHEFLGLIGATKYVRDRVVAFGPDVLVLPLYRCRESLDRPIADYLRDIKGAGVALMLGRERALLKVPIILVGFATAAEDIPQDLLPPLRYDHFLDFPEGLQELNPILSSYLGPAGGDLADVEKIKRRSSPSGPG